MGSLWRSARSAGYRQTPSNSAVRNSVVRLPKGATIRSTSPSRRPSCVSPPSWRAPLIGTFEYLSPEQLTGSSADARSDIWALGVLLYEMVSGLVPLDATHTGWPVD